MFRHDQPLIEAYAAQGPLALRRVLTFVVLSIRVPLWRVPADMRDPWGHAYGMKRDALHYLERNAGDLFDRVSRLRDIAPDADYLSAELLDTFLAVPGLGLVKAGFAAQLTCGLVGCIDSNNVVRLGLPPRRGLRSDTLKMRVRRPETRRARIDWYIDLCRKLGGAEALWNGWCHYVAERDLERSRYRDADHVSRLHVEAICV